MKNPHLCDNGCIGPFTPRPDIYNWLVRMNREMGLPTDAIPLQFDCWNCETTNRLATTERAA